MAGVTVLDFAAWVKNEELGFDPENAKLLPDGLYAAAKPLLFHWTVILGVVGDRCSYLDRWCFARRDDAIQAVRDWDGAGDPPGPWYRHPASGRRRSEGDAAREYVDP